MNMEIAVRNVKWWDDYTTDTVRIACAERHLAIISILETGVPHEVMVTVKGFKDEVDRFAEDVIDGSADPYEAETLDMSDEEYQEWLAVELKKIGIDYKPIAYDSDLED